MKTLIISDLHGENPMKFIDKQRREGIERLVSLGDYDAPEILERLLELDMNKVLLLGNHDYGFFRGEAFWSPLLQDAPAVYIEDWAKPRKARDYALKAAQLGEESQKVVENIGGREIVYVHGSLIDYRALEPLIWGRIIVDGNVRGGVLKANFNEMERQKYDIMFRGHDHMGVLFGIDKKNPSDQKFEDESQRLDPARRYIVGVGSFENGDYVVFDDKAGLVTFGDHAWKI